MMLVGTEEADEEEEDQLQIACALSHSEFVHKVRAFWVFWVITVGKYS